MNDENMVKEYLEAGVDLPELNEEQPAKEDAPAPQPDAPKGDEQKDEDEPLQETPKVERKRSIYDEYKEKKSELKSERELREQAERERDELKRLLEQRESAQTPEAQQDAQDELESFAREMGADPTAIKKMRDLFLKDARLDDGIQRDLAEFKAWKSQNAQLLEKQMFEEEYQRTIPTLKELLPGASDDELNAVKKELDRISHTEEYHDKDLEYIAWKHKDTLSTLISPKKRGMERKGRTDVQEESFDFDPNADLSRMSPKELDQWEKMYREMSETSTLATDAQGKKILI